MNIFLDCGTHKGEGLTLFMNRKIIDNTYKVYCFEPIPEITNLNNLNNIILENGEKIGDILDITFHNSAIWIKDGEIIFNSRNDHAAHVNGIGYNHDGVHEEKSIPSVDFSNFLNLLPKNSNVVCKMDIEGSEFVVLRKIISDGSIKKINKIFIEFHPHFMTYEDNTTVNIIIQDIIKSGVEVYLWH